MPTAQQLASLLGGELRNVSADKQIQGVNSLDRATDEQISFYANSRYKENLLNCRAGLILMAPTELAANPECAQLPMLLLDDPYGGLCTALEILTRVPPSVQPEQGGIHSHALVDALAKVNPTATIGAGAIIAAGATIGARTVIHPGVIVEADAKIGADCRIHAHVVIRYDCVLGDRCVLHPGVVIGGDGFGFAATARGLKKIPQRGNVVLEDDVEIGANSTIDRATFGSTTVGTGTKIDNLVMIGHNVEIGPWSMLVAQVGVSGSTRIGSGVQIGGQAGLAGHLHIGDFVRIGAQSGIADDIAAGSTVIGTLAMPHLEWFRVQKLMQKLPEIWKKVRRL